jgi:hypothetical protein
MHFDEHNEGDYRIYAAALASPYGSGYIAAVVVNRLRGVGGRSREAYRDVSCRTVTAGLRPMTPCATPSPEPGR